MYIVAISNRKGGVGKTTLTHTTGVVLSREMGQRVLMVDADPQASLSDVCRVDSETTLANVLADDDLTGAIYGISDKLHLIPSSDRLSDVEAWLSGQIAFHNKIKNTLATVADSYDICLLDTPPSRSALTIAALTAAQSVLLPCNPTRIDAQGMVRFTRTIGEIRTGLNPSLEILGVVITKHNARLLHHKSVVEGLKQGGFNVLPHHITQSIRVAEALAAGEYVGDYDPKNINMPSFRGIAKVIYDKAQG